MNRATIIKPNVLQQKNMPFQSMIGNIIHNSLFIIQKIRFILGWLAIAALTSGCTLQDWIGSDPASLELKDIVKFINEVINYLGAFGGLVTIFIMIAGYQSLMSAGSEEATTRAKDTIKYSAFGMVFLVFGYAIVRLIFDNFASGTNPFK